METSGNPEFMEFVYTQAIEFSETTWTLDPTTPQHQCNKLAVTDII
jgi:hypothetical protein